jgi:hypothetical protein
MVKNNLEKEDMPTYRKEDFIGATHASEDT